MINPDEDFANFDNAFSQEDFATLLDFCDGSNPQIVLQKYCDVPFTVLREQPLNLQYNQLVVVKISSTNKIGTGPFSALYWEGVRIQKEPDTP